MTSAVFHEAAADPATAAVPLSHLSVELGHLYLEDFAGGVPTLTRLMRRVAPWAETLRRRVSPAARVSTCFLVDDYFSTPLRPVEAVPMLLEAASAAGLTIDYLMRESACARLDGGSPAELVLDRLVPDPAPGTNGGRPSVRDSGWLTNGVRSVQPGLAGEAMKAPEAWQPASENGARRHSVFVDVELWSQEPDGRLYSCSFLAAVWQLLRLGLLRRHGQPVLEPGPWSGEFPANWADLPPLIQLNPDARPFSAYRTCSVLPNSFVTIELAVRTILSQVAVELAVMEQVGRRAAGEGLTLSPEIVDRIDYVFTGAFTV